MKYEHLKRVPVKDRPKSRSLAYCPEYFRGKYLFLFLCLLLPFLANCVIAGVINRSWESIIGLVIGSTGVLLFHVDILSGMVSSNVGTYFRSSEPVRYWLSLSPIIVVVIGVSVGVWH